MTGKSRGAVGAKVRRTAFASLAVWRAAAIVGLSLVGERTASAQHARPRFEPTDLDLHSKGAAEIDLQAGVMKGDHYARAFAPDFELSVGIASHAELEIDGTFGFEHFATPQFLDNTLIALRIGLVDFHDKPGTENAWAAGLQVGPRLPTLAGARGVGLEALGIVGRSQGKMHLFAQGGVLVDSTQRDESGSLEPRPEAIEGGLDLDLDLGETDTWSLKAELAGALYVSADDPQLQATLGPAYKVSDALELSAIGFAGFLKGGDRLGLLLGVATRFRAF
ncbi:MAG: hypothetical protein JWP97_5804 [Labilithrix sp.]|nr:hypothetical protein [Labilithrix sp.]